MSIAYKYKQTLHRQLLRCLQDQKDIRQELETIRTHLEDLTDSVKDVLILGDGNLSFSFSYGKLFPERNIDATILEPNISQFIERYEEGAKTILLSLNTISNVKVYYGVDATRKETFPKNKYDRIIMNFPHHGGKTNIKKARILLLDIFSAISELMSAMPSSSMAKFYLTLTKEQTEFRQFSSIFIEKNRTIEELKSEHYMDSWQALYLAANCQLECIRIQPLDPSFFTAYKAAGYKRTNRGFKNDLGVTYVFVKRKDISLMNDKRVIRALLPYYIHHFSFVLQKADRTDDFEKIPDILLRASNGTAVNCIEIEEIRTYDPQSKPNRIYSVVFQSSRPLSKKECNSLVDDTRLKIGRMLIQEDIALTLT